MMRINNLSNQLNNLVKNVLLSVSLCVFAAIFSVQAQENSFQLDWKSELKKVETLQGDFIRPEFEGASFNEANNYFPVFVTSFYTKQEVQAKLSDTQYEVVDSTTAHLLKELSFEPEIKVNNGKAAAQNIAVLTIFPFRKNKTSGAIEKLVSFKIQLTASQAIGNAKAARAASDYATHSVLASGNWFKISVEKTSMHKITYSFLKTKLNVNPSDISFSNFGVFGNFQGQLNEVAGQEPKGDDLLELPIYIADKNGNGKFDDGDFVLFYAQEPNTWALSDNGDAFNHKKHIYSDYNYYFITTDKGTGKQIADENFNGTANKTITTFDDYTFHELDEKNILESGREWFGDKMSTAKTSVDIEFSFPNLITSIPIKIVSSVIARTPQTTANNATQISGKIGGNTVFTHNIKGSGDPEYENVAIRQTLSENFNVSSENFKITYHHSSIDNTAEAYIDYVEINAVRALQFTGNSMNFRSINSVAPAAISEFQIANAGDANVWDVSNPFQAKREAMHNGSFITATSDLKEFVAFNSDANFPEPELVARVENQDLHACSQTNMVIVAYPSFLAAANRLAAFHRSTNNISVFVTTPDLIYNEFSSGKQDATAIRNFVKMLYDRANGDTALIPRYLLLFGDGSFDMRNRTAGSTNFIPTYQSYETLYKMNTFVSDDFFGLLDDGEGGNILGSNNFIDVAVGRLPVGSVEEAEGVVNKIINYKSTKALGNWRNRLSFVADDEDGNTHLTQCDGFANYVAGNYPIYNQNKIYLDAYQRVNTPAGARYPDVNTAILNTLNKGSLILNYVGHGGINNWAHERVFNLNDIKQLSNINTLPLFITATCEFSMFDKNGGQTAGENLIVNPNGGGIASITTVRLVWSGQNKELNDALIKNLFKPYQNRMPTMGELLMQAKNGIWRSGDANNRKFLLLGDPALTLNYPELNVSTSEVNGVNVNLSNDTMSALQQITISGEVQNWDGSVATDFNGYVYPTVFDKISTLTTLANSPYSSKVNFQLYNSVIFNGKASVQNGKFSFSFIVPKDIDYKIGEARISYYAEDIAQNIDAHGIDNSILIGGNADSVAWDDEGPVITLFINDTAFIDGGITDENPKLLAILEDDFGINVGNSLGHEITAVLDDNYAKPIVLNDYFESELNNYQKGSVLYPFYKLEEGAHTLTVKAWDTQNNSSEASISFVVSTSPILALNKIFCYPNPFSTSTTFSFEHNAADEDLLADVKIYSLNGDMVRHIQAEFTPSGYRENKIKWNGDTDTGGSVMKGIYIYKITLQDKHGNQASKSNRVVVIK